MRGDFRERSGFDFACLKRRGPRVGSRTVRQGRISQEAPGPRLSIRADSNRGEIPGLSRFKRLRDRFIFN